MLLKFLGIIIFFFSVVGISISQDSDKEAKMGNYSFLKGQSQLNLEFDYHDMTVGKKTESEYCDDKIFEYNNQEDGKGDWWFEEWRAARKERYEPDFIESLSQELSGSGISVSTNKQTQYTLIVKTLHTEPGYYAGRFTKASYCTFQYTFRDNSNESEFIYYSKRISGESTNIYKLDVVKRISINYWKAARLLGSYISDFLIKN